MDFMSLNVQFRLKYPLHLIPYQTIFFSELGQWVEYEYQPLFRNNRIDLLFCIERNKLVD